MTSETIDLKTFKFFEDFTPEHLKIFQDTCQVVELKKGDTLFKTGEKAEHFFFIKKGHVQIQIYTKEKGPQEIQTEGPGEVLGMSWLIPPYQWQFDVLATSDCEILQFDGYDLKKAFKDDPHFGQEVMLKMVSTISQRLIATRKKLISKFNESEA